MLVSLLPCVGTLISFDDLRDVFDDNLLTKAPCFLITLMVDWLLWGREFFKCCIVFSETFKFCLSILSSDCLGWVRGDYSESASSPEYTSGTF